MNVQCHVLGLDMPAPLRRRLEQTLESFQSLIPIANAAVVLEHEQENALPYRVFVLLAVAGPVIQAEARGHSVEAAWLKVTSDLRRQIERSQSRKIAGSRRFQPKAKFRKTVA